MREITEDDIGKQVRLRNGEITKLVSFGIDLRMNEVLKTTDRDYHLDGTFSKAIKKHHFDIVEILEDVDNFRASLSIQDIQLYHPISAPDSHSQLVLDVIKDLILDRGVNGLEVNLEHNSIKITLNEKKLDKS
jgi:hypothetical protein